MEYNTEPRNKLLHIGSIDFQQGCKDHSIVREESFQQIVLGQLDIHMQKNKVETLSSYHIQKVTQNRSNA